MRDRAAPHGVAGGAPEKKSLREMQRDMTREHIVGSALSTFDRLGFAATTMDDIADAANVNRGTLYLHFSNKADILRAALARITGLRENYEVAADAATEPEVRRLLESTVAYWRSGVAGVWRHMRDAAAVDPAIREWQTEYDARQRRVFEEILVGRGVPAEQAGVRAFLLMSMYAEVLYQLATEPDLTERPGFVDALVGFYLTALRPS